MAAVVRVKRRLDDDPVETLVLLCKKAKTDQSVPGSAPLATPECTDEIKSVFQFAGTVSDKDKTVSHYVTQAITKSRLQTLYKQPRRTTDGVVSNAQKHRSLASDARYKVMNERRAVEESVLIEDGSNSDTSHAVKCPPQGQQSNHIFCVCDIEKLESPSNTPADSRVGEVIMCNNVPMVRETSAPPVATGEKSSDGKDDDHYVYDVYYAKDVNFDFRSLEQVLTVEAMGTENAEFLNDDDGSEEDEAAYDEDDENDENNWRNDYPDDDPLYFERLQLDDDYNNYSSDDENAADRCYSREENASDDEP